MKQLLLLLIVFYTSTLNAQKVNTAKLDSLFNALEKNNKAMGTISIVKGNKKLYEKSIGYSQKTNDKANANTIYHIGSISKMFTSCIIFQLIEEKKLYLFTKLSDYYPQIKNADKITISNMLNHRSGIYNFTRDTTYLEWNTQAKSKQELLNLIADYEPAFEPDSEGDYSNSNYVLLSFIIEDICQKPYAQVVKERVIDKIKLQNTFFGTTVTKEKYVASSYEYEGKWELQPVTHYSIPLGAGAIISTPNDLNIFIQALFNVKIISASSLKQMTEIEENIGRGIFQYPFYERKAFGHTGGIDGFSSVLSYFPDDSVSVALCLNGKNYSTNSILLKSLEILYNKPTEIPVFKTYKHTPEQLQNIVGEYSSASFPLKIKIFIEGISLKAQADGQGDFALEGVALNEFEFIPAGIKMSFNPANNTMSFTQGEGKFDFKKN